MMEFKRISKRSIKLPERVSKWLGTVAPMAVTVSAWVFSTFALLLAAIVPLIPRFFDTYLKVIDGKIPRALWGYGALSIGAVLLTTADKIWTKKREVAAKKRRVQQDSFFKEYTAHIAKVVTSRVGEDFKGYLDTVGDAVALRGLAPAYSLDEARRAQKATLKNICSAVAIYFDEGNDEIRQKYNASLMIPEACEVWRSAPGGKFKDAVRFFDFKRDVESCTVMLHLTVWAREPQGWKPFVLAVDGDADHVLPGAPRAYFTRELQIIGDTREKEEEFWKREMPEHAISAKRQLRNYFEENEDRFRSFFSVPLFLDERIVGILNVQSRETHILAGKPEQQEDLELSLQPFCALLVALITRESSVQSPDGSG